MVAPSPLSGKRILIVEDNALIAASLSYLLIEQGCVVEGPAFTAQQAIRIIDRYPLDGAFLDVELREGLGVDVARILRLKGVPFVVITGYPQDSLPPELIDAHYLAKPTGEDDILGMAIVAFRRGQFAQE